jgi:hypothetical protein
MDLLGQVRHLRNLLTDDFELPLSLLVLQADHPDFLFLLPYCLFSLLQSVLLDVTLFVVDAKLVIPVNQLNTHVVSALTGHLILVNQVVHLFLERIDNKVELVTLIDLLTDY